MATFSLSTADDGVQTSHDGKGLPFGESISFETDSFKGKFFLRLRNGNGVSHSPYFDGKTCLYQLVIQGQFKIDSLTFADLMLGDIYDRPLKGVPSRRSMMGKMIKRFVEGMSPGVIFDIFHDKQPMVLAPIGSCQTMTVDLPGDEPSDFDEIKESTALLGYFGSGDRRRKYCPSLQVQQSSKSTKTTSTLLRFLIIPWTLGHFISI